MSDFQSIKEILDKTGMYAGLTSGTSMLPMIHHQRDTVIIVKNTQRLKKYDVPVYLTKNGKYVMHRVIEVHSDHYIIVGDNLLEREYVTDDMICGVLAGFYKNGKHYYDLEKSVLYKLYSRVWVALLPIRPFYLFVKRCISRIVRHIFKRGN